MSSQLETPKDLMNFPRLNEAVVSLLFQLADDELILGHRDSEWLGLAPEIEEDVAFSSISQDEVGHASFYYGLLSDLEVGHADDLAYGRKAAERLNALLVERDNGDWAHTIVRHFFYDVFDEVRLLALENSAFGPLRRGAMKIRREEYYHQLHLKTWFVRLCRAGGEARDRMMNAIQERWSDIENLFDLGDYEDDLLSHGILTMSSTDMLNAWLTRMQAVFDESGIQVPEMASHHHEPRTTHTSELETLLGVMSEVYEIEPGAIW